MGIDPWMASTHRPPPGTHTGRYSAPVLAAGQRLDPDGRLTTPSNTTRGHRGGLQRCLPALRNRYLSEQGHDTERSPNDVAMWMDTLNSAEPISAAARASRTNPLGNHTHLQQGCRCLHVDT